MLANEQLNTNYPNEFDNSSENNLFSNNPNLEVKVTQDSRELAKAKVLRLKYHATVDCNQSVKNQINNNTLNSKKLIEQQQNIIHDGYDSFAEHMIVFDHSHDKVIAYIRLIDAYTAYKIGGYYCETRFNLNRLFNNQSFFIEISRLVVDPQYNNKEVATLIWSGLINYAQEKGADAIMGSLTLPVKKEKTIYPLLHRLKKNHISASHCRVFPYQLLPDTVTGNSSIVNSSTDNKLSAEDTNPVIDYFFEQGVKLCGDAYWNKEFNTAELFIHYQINKAPLFPECIRMNEVDLGLLCEETQI